MNKLVINRENFAQITIEDHPIVGFGGGARITFEKVVGNQSNVDLSTYFKHEEIPSIIRTLFKIWEDGENSG